jgi:hypothetical protein
MAEAACSELSACEQVQANLATGPVCASYMASRPDRRVPGHEAWRELLPLTVSRKLQILRVVNKQLTGGTA